MSKRTLFTTITPLPPQVSREIAMDTLHSSEEMIDLNPLVEERHPISAPAKAPAEEAQHKWFEITDRVTYLPGGLYSGKVTYLGSFIDLPDGLKTHCYAPMGLEIKSRWTLAGSLPGEPQTETPEKTEPGVPSSGLYLREDVDMRCNILMTSFVKRTLKKAHETLVARIMVKVQLQDKAVHNEQISERAFVASNPTSPNMTSVYVGSVQGSPGFPPPNTFYPDALRYQSQSPFASGLSYQSMDQMGSMNSSPSPNSQIDASYQDSNPYIQQRDQGQQSPYPSYVPPGYGTNEGFQYPIQGLGNAYAISDFPYSQYSTPEGMDTDIKMETTPPVHEMEQPEPTQPTFSPIELPPQHPR